MSKTQTQTPGEEMDFEKASAVYPHIPSSVLVKIEASRRGTKLSAAAQKAIQKPDTATTDYRIFSIAFDKPETRVDQRPKVPSRFCLKRDDTHIVFRPNPQSPYTIDTADNRFFFTDDRLGPTPLEEVYFVPAPKSLSRVLPDGTPYERVLTPVGLDKLAFTIRYYCEFWNGGEQCKFCDIGSYGEVKKKRGLDAGAVAPQAVARVVREVFQNERAYRHLAITGGTILDAEKETDINCAYLHAIREGFGGVWYPAHFAMVAREEKYLRRVRETGVPVINMNLEVWDERLFNIICPGKARQIGREEWINRLIKAVEIFGRGNVCTDYVAGIELAQPWGFEDALPAVESTLEGLDFLMGHGVLPRFNMWISEHGSVLRGQAPPPLAYYVELFMGFLELVGKHQLAFPSPDRCRACFGADPTADLWYYLHKEEPCPKAA